ncbi:MAG: site-specific integrase, partial [bacterium]|nr:site-specific integrase [bacterium]
MSHVQHRRSQTKPWVARYRSPDGRERSKSFKRKIDADQYLAQVEVDKVSGDWVDPPLGRRTLDSWWDEWWPTLTSLRETSRARDESNYLNHVKPIFGSMPLDGIDHRLIQPWIAELSDGLAPATVQKVHQILSKMLRSAIDAGLIKTNPCDKTDLPRVETTE